MLKPSVLPFVNPVSDVIDRLRSLGATIDEAKQGQATYVEELKESYLRLFDNEEAGRKPNPDSIKLIEEFTFERWQIIIVSLFSKDDEKLSSRMQQLASQHRRWGVVTIHDVCKREGLVVNPKRSLRLYRKLRLQIKLRPKKKKGNVIRMPIAKPRAPNEVWSMDFIFDRLANGRALKILNVVDDFSRRCVGQIVASSITG